MSSQEMGKDTIVSQKSPVTLGVLTEGVKVMDWQIGDVVRCKASGYNIVVKK